MAYNASSFGVHIYLRASVSLPTGVILSHFPDDVDPISTPNVPIGTVRMGLNGDLITVSSPNAIVSTIGVITNSGSDEALNYIYSANRPASGKNPAGDAISLVAYLPNGASLSLSDGWMMDGPPVNTYLSSGAVQMNTYSVGFANAVRTPAIT